MHLLRFEESKGWQMRRYSGLIRAKTGWLIYLEGHDSPIGAIYRGLSGGWLGYMHLAGYCAQTSAATHQAIIDEFAAWVAAGTPSDSVLVRGGSHRVSSKP